jgi:WD40 repeat protein
MFNLLPAPDVFAMQRKDCKDWLSLYSTSSGWELQARVQLQTLDAADIAWSPDSSKLAVWDSPLTYAVHVVGPDGGSLGSYSAYGDGLGVRSVSWSPGGDLLAVGSYDQVGTASSRHLLTVLTLMSCCHIVLLFYCRVSWQWAAMTR